MKVTFSFRWAWHAQLRCGYTAPLGKMQGFGVFEAYLLNWLASVNRKGGSFPIKASVYFPCLGKTLHVSVSH